MRKTIKYKILGLALLLVSIVACDTAEQDVSPVISPDGKPVATFTSPGTTVTEGDTIIYNIAIDKMIDRSITFSFKQTGGTGTEADFVVVPGILQPYTLSTEVMVITLNDAVLGDAKTIIGEVGAFTIADRYLLNPSTVNPKPTLTINNFISPDLKVSFSWDQEVLIDGVPLNAADNMDWDMFVSVADGFDISNPWASEIGIYDAATGSHPEELTLSGLDDGEYILWADLYASDFAGSTNDSSLIAITTTFNREGTSLVDFAVVQDSSQRAVANQADGGVFDGVLVKVVVAGGTYQIVDFKGNDLGTYKSSATKTKRPASIPHTE